MAQEDPTDEKSYMFFIAKGDCFVKIKDRLKDGTEEINHRSLLPGDHFGVSLCLFLSFIIGSIIVIWMLKNSKCDS